MRQQSLRIRTHLGDVPVRPEIIGAGERSYKNEEEPYCASSNPHELRAGAVLNLGDATLECIEP